MEKPLATTMFRIRENLGLTQADVARISGINPTQISHYESGDRDPSIQNLVAIAKALKCSTDKLLGIVTNEWDEGFSRGVFECREQMINSTSIFFCPTDT